MKKKLTITLLAITIAVGMTAIASADEGEEDTSVTVDVDEVAQVDVRPSELDFTNPLLEPGQDRQESDGGFEHVEISNIGSVDIQEVTAEATMPTEAPFAVSSEDHNTGNFVTLSTETAETEDYDVELASGSISENTHYLNRVEYAEDNAPEYISTELEEMGDASFTPNNVDVGRFRAGGLEYFYAAYYNDDMTDGSEAVLRIGNAPHTTTELGTVDFTNDGDAYTEYEQSDIGETPGNELDGFYGQITEHNFVVFDPDEGENSEDYDGEELVEDGNAIEDDESPRGELDEDFEREYNLYTHFEDGSDEGHIQRTRFNTQVFDATDDGSDPDRSNEESSGAQTPLIDGSGDDALNPGQNVPINFGVQLPLGTDAEDITQGTVSFVVTADDE